MKALETLLRKAVLSECGSYRYALTREWADGKCVAWLMLNPSTADADIDDPTIRRCIGFAKQWGYGRLVVVNLFALRATDPRVLVRNADPVGSKNNFYIAKAMKEAQEVICAWGCQQHLRTIALRQRLDEVLMRIPNGLKTTCLGYRRDGAPRHPLMVGYQTPRTPFVSSRE